MTEAMSPAEIRRALERQGVPSAKIAMIAGDLNLTDGSPIVGYVADRTQPVTLTIRWSSLVSDNDKFVPASRKKGESGRMVLTARYREAKDTVQHIAREAMVGRSPFRTPVRFQARVW